MSPRRLARRTTAVPDIPCHLAGRSSPRSGHPVVLGREHYDAIVHLAGDRGARDLLRGGRTIECAGLGSDRDVDTPEDLEAIRHEARAVI